MILSMTVEGLYKYISKLWAMLIWGNKKYIIDKMIQLNLLKGSQQSGCARSGGLFRCSAT
jgi:hypothetical protein